MPEHTTIPYLDTTEEISTAEPWAAKLQELAPGAFTGSVNSHLTEHPGLRRLAQTKWGSGWIYRLSEMLNAGNDLDYIARAINNAISDLNHPDEATLVKNADTWRLAPLPYNLSVDIDRVEQSLGNIYADLQFKVGTRSRRRINRFSVGSPGADASLSGVIRRLSPVLGIDNDGERYAYGEDEATLAALKILDSVFEASDEEQDLTGLVSNPFNPIPPKPNWLIEPLVTDGGVSIIFGQPSAGKSMLATSALLAAVSGVAVAGFDPPDQTMSSAMYVYFEGATGSWEYRRDALGRGAGLIGPNQYAGLYDLDLRGRGTLRDLAPRIKDAIETHSCELVVIDSATSAAVDAIDPGVASATMQIMQSWGIPVLLLAHSPKQDSETVYGSQVWTALTRLALKARSEPSAVNELVVTIGGGKPGNDLGRIAPRRITYTFGHGEILASSTSTEINMGPTVHDRIKEALSEHPGQSGQELAETTGLSKSAISKTLKASPTIFIGVKQGRSKAWSLSDDSMLSDVEEDYHHAP